MTYADYLLDAECLARQRARSCPANGCWSCALAERLAEYDRLGDNAQAHPRKYRRFAASKHARTFNP